MQASHELIEQIAAEGRPVLTPAAMEKVRQVNLVALRKAAPFVKDAQPLRDAVVVGSVN